MRVFRGLHRTSLLAAPTALAIGNFDGLHLGHQAILRRLVDRAKAARLISVVLTFSPHPEKVLGQGKIAMIQTLNQRLAGLKKSGVEAVLVAPFDLRFSRLSSREFFDRVVISLLHAEEVVIGQDFRFGLNRQGDVDTLRQLASEKGVLVHPVPPVRVDDQVVSSSLIRAYLEQGRVEQANRLLGRPYEIEGRVGPGSARGKSLGFPTANVLTANEITPAGVFITEAVLGRKAFPSVTNVGFRPTFEGGSLQVETFLFFFNGSLYGKKIRLRFLQKIREEQKFPTPEDLVRQVRQDIEVARGYFELQRKMPGS